MRILTVIDYRKISHIEYVVDPTLLQYTTDKSPVHPYKHYGPPIDKNNKYFEQWLFEDS